jgi:hypothetical protein
MIQNQQVPMAFINNMKHVAFDFLFRPDFLSPEKQHEQERLHE